MDITTLVVGAFAVNCYLLKDSKSGDGLIIDPGAQTDSIADEIEKIGLTPKAILLTHGHGDHISAVDELRDRFRIPLYAGRDEAELLANADANMSADFGAPTSCRPAEHQVADEDLISVGPFNFKVLATPGHSPGSVCYLHQETGVLFCGDTLFAGSIGRTDFPGCSLKQLLDSIHRQIMTLPDQVICYPGHGPSTTVGTERVSNPFVMRSNLA